MRVTRFVSLRRLLLYQRMEHLKSNIQRMRSDHWELRSQTPELQTLLLRDPAIARARVN